MDTIRQIHLDCQDVTNKSNSAGARCPCSLEASLSTSDHGVSTDLQAQLQHSLGDLYVIERELAPGGMSRLFLATEASLGRKVVIKMLPPETASDVSAARFQREVQLAAHLQHPNILPVLSTGSTGEGFFYVMPFVAGESLRQRLESGARFPIHEALAYGVVANAWSSGDAPQRALAAPAATKVGQLGGDQPIPTKLGNSDR